MRNFYSTVGAGTTPAVSNPGRVPPLLLAPYSIPSKYDGTSNKELTAFYYLGGRLQTPELQVG